MNGGTPADAVPERMTAPPPDPPLISRGVFGVCVAAALALALAGARRAAPDIIDDAHITFRYVDNLLAGHGLVYNPGGERVEGFSNPLQVFLLWAAGLAGIGREAGGRIFGAAGWMFAVLGAAGIARGLGATRRGGWLAGAAVAAHVPLLYYALTGLETGVMAGLIAAALWRYAARGGRMDALGAALWLAVALARPEGGMYPFALGVWELWRWVAARREATPGAEVSPRGQQDARPLGWGGVGWLAAVGIGIVLALLARHAYFGAWLPNTFTAKPPGTAGLNPEETGWQGGLLYLKGFLTQWGFLLPVLGIGWLVRLVSSAQTRPPVAPASAIVIACGLAFGFYTGGDWMPGARYLLPVVPVLAAAGVAGAEAGWGAYASRRKAETGVSAPGAIREGLAATMVLSFIAGPALLLWEFTQMRELYPYHVMNSRTCWEAGEDLRRTYGTDKRLVAYRIGAVGRSSGMIVEDLFGLVDREIATIISKQHGYHPGTLYGDDVPELKAVLARRKPDLLLIHDVPNSKLPRRGRFYGYVFTWRRTYSLGADQTWELYERTN